MIKKIIHLFIIIGVIVAATLSIYLLVPRMVGVLWIIPGEADGNCGYFRLYNNGAVKIPENGPGVKVQKVMQVEYKRRVQVLLFGPDSIPPGLLSPIHQVPLSRKDQNEIKQLIDQLIQGPAQDEKMSGYGGLEIIKSYVNHKYYALLREGLSFPKLPEPCEALRALAIKIATSLPPGKTTPITPEGPEGPINMR